MISLPTCVPHVNARPAYPHVARVHTSPTQRKTRTSARRPRPYQPDSTQGPHIRASPEPEQPRAPPTHLHVYIFSGAETPMRLKLSASTRRTASHTIKRAWLNSSSSGLPSDANTWQFW